MDTALVKIKNPVEYSFWCWIKGFPESGHPCDKERFLLFVRNVCSYNATKWKNVEFLENKILSAKKNCNKEWLEQTLIIYESLIEFYKTNPTPKTWFINQVNTKPLKNHYIEIGWENGEFYEKQIKMKR